MEHKIQTLLMAFSSLALPDFEDSSAFSCDLAQSYAVFLA